MNGDDYAQLQTRRDEEYRRVYTKWVAGLSGDARQDLQRKGLLTPDLGCPVGASREEDAAESREASFTVDMAAMLDDLPEFLMEQMGMNEEHAQLVAAWHTEMVETHAGSYKAWLFNKLVAGFLQSRNAKLSAVGLGFATNLAGLNGARSMMAWSKRNRLTRSAVSRVTKYWQRELKLLRSAHMKTKTACVRYAEGALGENHWRNKHEAVYDGKRLGRRSAIGGIRARETLRGDLGPPPRGGSAG